MTAPLAVVFQTTDGGIHEMWVPPGFAVVLYSGGILITNEDDTVSTLLSVRPVQGETDAPEDDADREGGDVHLDEPEGLAGDDDGGVEDPPDDAGGGDAGDPGEGEPVRTLAERGALAAARYDDVVCLRLQFGNGCHYPDCWLYCYPGPKRP